MEFTPTNLKIIADDLGLAVPVNRGIFDLMKSGHVDGASLMANGEAFDDAIEITKMLPQANIGIHLVLVEEKSLTGIKLPKNHKEFFIKYIFGLINKKKIEAEFCAQIQKILHVGIKPVFINSHQHLHLLPGIMDIVIKIAKENNIEYIRLVNELIRDEGKIFRKLQLLFLNFLSSLAKKKLEKHGLKYNDFFVGFINAGNLDKKDLQKAQELKNKHPDEIIELGCHPGFEDDQLRVKYKHWAYNWREEYDLLKNV